ncbi:hypothetical protein K505DRAFT_328059 [Melanomma pulvis-pyrius CBS 109.77]|uniref:Uncharacterized protein n=1 Tax=Melanomma pulvis-pyrius CBS 109.77 TaxID=1314802 RepID=A0A6A6WZN5_9PLEO|nr:hypothetical protein K505DRAFT_328059 [Melanomma pulvis-pyrius CBS 109.77]
MPDSAANSYSASRPLETPEASDRSSTQISAPPPLHHGPGIADSTPAATLPPTLTPATTTRQSISLGVLSTLWGASNNSTIGAIHPHGDASIPAIVTHAPSPDAQEPPSDLTASTSSVPSTATTLTNTLPPTQSAALRALNAPAFQSHASSNPKSKSAKSTSSRTTLSSQPVVVRTYSGSRHNSRPSSGPNTPRLFPSMNGNTSQNPSALSAGLAGRSERLPSVEDFSFSAILRAVDPEIRDAIDAIAEICARSRLSLADEYDAHLPPQGEITDTWGTGMGALVGRGRISRIGQGWSAADNTLTAVPEASSSSERLAGESRSSMTAGSKKRSRSAYGSLKSVISGGSGKRKAVEVDAFQHAEQRPQGPAWAVNHPAITLIASPQASKQLSLDISSTIKDIPESSEGRLEPTLTTPKLPLHRRHTSSTSIPPPGRARSSTLSSLASWLPWPRASDLDANSATALTKAESRLREMLILSQTSSLGKGKAPLRVA